jgi:hypothetical protein
MEVFWERRLKYNGVHQDEMFARLIAELEYAILLLSKHANIVAVVNSPTCADVLSFIQKIEEWEKLLAEAKQIAENFSVWNKPAEVKEQGAELA